MMMETLAAQLEQSYAKYEMMDAEVRDILNSNRSQDLSEAYHRQLEGHEARFKQQEKENLSHKEQVVSLQSGLNLLQAKKEAEERLISSLQEELAHLQQEEETLAKGHKPSISETKLRQLEYEEALFRQWLSMEISKVQGGWLQVVFTQIDPKKPESKFFFTFKLDEEKKYVVGDCQPPLEDMNALVKQLNASNNLSKFVHSVRKRFKMSLGS